MFNRSVFVLSRQKTATQSVFHSIRATAPEFNVFHAHELDNADARLRLGPPEGGDEAYWRHKIGKGLHLLRALLDVRTMKTIVSVRRTSEDRVWSHLFHSYHALIAPHYDPLQDQFDMEELHCRIDGKARYLLHSDTEYAQRVYAPLGINAELAERAYSATLIRDDLEFVCLRFEELTEDFAKLADHLGLPEVRLLHKNPARDRSQDAIRDPENPSEVERKVYRAFLRDYPPRFRAKQSAAGSDVSPG